MRAVLAVAAIGIVLGVALIWATQFLDDAPLGF